MGSSCGESTTDVTGRLSQPAGVNVVVSKCTQWIDLLDGLSAGGGYSEPVDRCPPLKNGVGLEPIKLKDTINGLYLDNQPTVILCCQPIRNTIGLEPTRL
jgi:hypothetical protein